MQGTNLSEGGKSLLCDPGSELQLGGREKKKGEDNKWDVENKNPRLVTKKKKLNKKKVSPTETPDHY